MDDKTQTIIPDRFYRWNESLPYLGSGKTQAQEAIKRGELEAPIPISKRAVAFMGIQLIRYQKRLLAKADELRAKDPLRNPEHPAHVARKRKAKAVLAPVARKRKRKAP